MSSNQIVRRRLNSLKNITEQLKNSTTSGRYNFSHIKSLLGNLKHISQMPTQQTIKHEDADHYPYAFTEQSRQITTENTFEEEEYRPLFQESIRKKQNKTFSKSFQESEIIDLRQQNLKLEEKLASLREQLCQLKQKSERTSEEKQSNKLPFFSLGQTLQTFICRYDISEENYTKIEYTQYEVQLKLDRLVLIRKQKNSLEQLDLSTLINVKYIDSHHILFIFEEFVQSEYLHLEGKDHPRSELTNLFVKFSSEQIQHKWDLSLFMNFNIVNSLHQQKLFEPYFKRLVEERKVLREKNDITEIRQSKQLDDKKEKDLLKILIKRRQEYLEIRTLIQQKLGHNKLQNQNNEENQQQQKVQLVRRHPDIPQPLTLLNGTDRVSISLSEKSKQKINNKYWQQSQYNSMPPSIIQQISQVQQNMQRSHPQKESRMNYSPSFAGLATTDQKTFRRESETFPFGQIPYQTQNNFKPFPSNVSSPRMKQLSINTIKTNKSLSDRPEKRLNSLTKSKQIQNKVTDAKQSLQNGYYATKYSKDGFYPHQKKIFLSLDSKKLCWSEKDKESDYKGIPLEVITKIEYAAVGEGIKKHVKSPQPKYYCVIEYFSGEYKKKTIELGSGNYQQIKKFTQQLQMTVNNQRGMPLGGINEH